MQKSIFGKVRFSIGAILVHNRYCVKGERRGTRLKETIGLKCANPLGCVTNITLYVYEAARQSTLYILYTLYMLYTLLHALHASHA